MPGVLLCATTPLDDELVNTVLWREDVERHETRQAEDALEAVRSKRPDLLIVDRELPGAERLIRDLRSNPATRTTSIAVIARTELAPVENALLEAGANSVLRGPGGPEWDDRLARLMTVPVRREIRLPVRIRLETRQGPAASAGHATTLNLSASGMLVETDAALHVGDDLDLRFQLPDSSADVIGAARVIRQADPRCFGIELTHLEVDGAELIQRFVERSAETAC